MGAHNYWPLPFAVDDEAERASWTKIAADHGTVTHSADGQIGLLVSGPSDLIRHFAASVGAGHVSRDRCDGASTTSRWHTRGSGLVGTLARAMWDDLIALDSHLVEDLRPVAWPTGLTLCSAPGCPAPEPNNMRCCLLHAQLLLRSNIAHPLFTYDLQRPGRCWCRERFVPSGDLLRRGLCQVCRAFLAATIPLARRQRSGWDRDTWNRGWWSLALPDHDAIELGWRIMVPRSRGSR